MSEIEIETVGAKCWEEIWHFKRMPPKCSGLVHWEDPEGSGGEGGGRGDWDGDYM